MHGRLAARELDRHLAARLDLSRVLEDFLDFVPPELMDIAYLVRVHKAGIAHHIAAVREIHGQDRTTSVTYRARAMVVQVFVVVRRDVAAREILLDPFEE